MICMRQGVCRKVTLKMLSLAQHYANAGSLSAISWVRVLHVGGWGKRGRGDNVTRGPIHQVGHLAGSLGLGEMLPGQ